jgi:two-component system cell cycle response regulator
MNETQKPNILLVDDRPENLLALESLLEGPDLNLVKATSGNEALGLTLKYDFALFLLDVQMPDMDGFETAELMRSSERTRPVPIIFVTAINKEQKHVFKGYESGAVDYLFKPLDPDILQSKVRIFLELHNQKKGLERMNEELRKANEKILEQQKAIIEEERLKVLLQIAGTAVHELSQPLMGLLGNIQLMRMNKDNQEQLDRHMDRVEEACQRISDIMGKIKIIGHDEIKPFPGQSITNIEQQITILSVEGSDDDFRMISDIFEDDNRIVLQRAKGIEEAMRVLGQGQIDMIFLDYFLPDGNGLDFLRAMEKGEIEIPTVVITGKGDEIIATQMIQAGAYDYLTKDNVSAKSLSRIVGNTLEKAQLKREVKGAYKKMAEMSTRDELTKLYNRRYFNEVLERAASRAGRYETNLTLWMIDIDHFKKINDTYGHPAGDMVLSELAKILETCVRHSDVCCRYGGEEFAVILPDTDTKSAKIVCERFRELIAAHEFQYDSSGFHCTVSAGITPYNRGKEQSTTEFIEMADKALYQAKEDGRNRVVELTL